MSRYKWNKRRQITVETGQILYKNILHKLTRFLPDKVYLKIVFYKNTKYKLSLKKPQTFNEKLQWLKIYNRDPFYTMLVDKYEVKNYVKEKIGQEYVIPTLGLWKNVEDINLKVLPDRFVLKCTHDSGSVVLCEDKSNFDFCAAKKKLRCALNNNYFWDGREWPYKNVKPRIIAEPYLDNKGQNLVDYKLMCFNGKVKCSFVVTDRFSTDGIKVTFFDRNWNRMPFERHYPSSKEEIPKPLAYELMVDLAEKLSEHLVFVRVDFYEIAGQIYFGELTFSPGGGFEEFTPLEWDYKLGDWLILPKDKPGKCNW